MRCRATERERGEPIWQTRSTEPMSIPSSREAVATRAHTSPAFSFFPAASGTLRNNFDGLLRSRKTDPHRAPIGQIFQSLQGKRQVRAALVISDGVDFVHNNSLDIPQDFAALLRGQ